MAVQVLVIVRDLALGVVPVGEEGGDGLGRRRGLAVGVVRTPVAQHANVCGSRIVIAATRVSHTTPHTHAHTQREREVRLGLLVPFFSFFFAAAWPFCAPAAPPVAAPPFFLFLFFLAAAAPPAD
jgi:hypothetical protein